MSDTVGIHRCTRGSNHYHFLVGEDFPLAPFYSLETGQKLLGFYQETPKMKPLYDQLLDELEQEARKRCRQLNSSRGYLLRKKQRIGDIEVNPVDWLKFYEEKGGEMNVALPGFWTNGGAYIPVPTLMPVMCDFIMRPGIEDIESDTRIIARAHAIPRSVTQVLTT